MMASNGSNSVYPYPYLREILGPGFRGASPEQIEALFEVTDISAEDVESFFSNIGRAFGSAARTVGRALPQVAQVAAPIAQAALPIVGGALGGPLGAAVGGMAGQAIGSLAGQQRQPQAPSAVPTPPRRLAPGATAAGPPAVGGAAAQLMQLLGDPRLMRALGSLALGPAGSRTLPVGNTRVSPAAVTNLLGVLANQATAEALAYESSSGVARTYLENYIGESAGDPAIAESRAAAVWELLQETLPVSSGWYERDDPESEMDDSEQMMIDYYDQLFDLDFETWGYGNDSSDEMEQESWAYTDYETD